MADLQDIFARLKNQSESAQSHSSPNAPPPSLWAQPPAHQQPSVSSPLFSPPIQTPNPVHSSNIISPVNPSSAVGTPGPDANNRNNLLNLLKFNGQSGQQQGQAGPMANLQNVNANRHSSMHVPQIQSRDSGHGRPLSAVELMNNLQRSTSTSGVTPSPMAAAGAEKENQSGNPQDFLLNLLKKPSSQHSQGPAFAASQTPQVEKLEKHDPDVEALAENLASATVESATSPRPKRETTPARQFGSPASRATPFEAPQPTKSSMFNYVNPFDQLHSSSPLNRTPKPEQQAEMAQSAQPKKIEILKHNRDISANQNGESALPASKSRKLESNDTPLTHTESKGQQSVSEALENVGEQVDKQVEQALAEADSKPIPDVKKSEPEIKKETIDNDDVESSWESAEDTNSEGSKVEVFNFPMKPFVSIQVKQTKPARPIRQEHFMVIAQLKKEFDQIDRCLATASQTHIVYAQVATKKDNYGLRIIRQDTGDHQQIFRSNGERIFSVQLCADANDTEAILGTGVNGSVFWTSVARSRGDLFKDDDIEAQSFIMPPVQTAEENTSGSPVKTRAKLSSRHPDFFAVARGKQIFLVAPNMVKDKAYLNPTTRKVSSEQYFIDHSLIINTGKAGKDFCFSEDDSTIVSLDKNGRFKFWDIRDLTQRTSDLSPGKHETVELKDPLWTLNAAASGSKPDEKPSVSSIMFLDKDRPYKKCTALRYLLIGFKQNHILQLWDLGLGKAVQEIRLPHEKDSDGICSISYHPTNGVIALAHPTRNSIYFIHLSAPKYAIPTMDQARYIKMLATNDSALPKPDSTAIMSGLREYSFAKVGQLRSVDMLRTPVENASERTPEETLFELYAMHSKGAIGISIKREDLGWDAQNKMVNPKDAVKEGVVDVNELAPAPKLTNTSEQSSNADTVPSKAKSNSTKKSEPVKQPPPPKVEIKKAPAPGSAANGAAGIPPVASPEPASTAAPPPAATNPPFMTPDSYSLAAQRSKSPQKAAEEAVATAKKSAVSPPKPAQAVSLPSSSSTSGDVQDLLSQQFDSLYQRIESDKRVQDAAAGAKQDALLRLVSSTLTENVDRSLANIIASRIEKDVVPTLNDVTSKIIDRKIGEPLPQQLNASVASAMKGSLSTTLTQALKDKEIHRVIQDVTANAVATKVQQQVQNMLQQSLPGMATQAAQKMVADVEQRINMQLQQAEVQRQQDNAKIEELSSIVRSLSTTIQNMAAGQTAFQEQVLKMQRESKSQTSSTASNESAPPAAADPPPEPQDTEVAAMTELLVSGQYEQATISWISSDRQAEIFDKLFVRVNPQYLTQVSPLVALTVSAAITSSFDTYINERLDWLSLILNQIDIRDTDIKDVAPKIMDVLSQRLQGAYMEISEATPQEPILRTLSTLNRQVLEIRRLAQ